MGAFILVVLRGGADGLHLVPPLGEAAYHDARPLIAVSEAEAIPLDAGFGLHPELRELAPLLRAGQLTVVPACGSDDDTRSHFEAQDLIERGARDASGGWLGRWLRQRRSAGALASVAWGKTLPESLRGAPRASALGSLAPTAAAAALGALREPLAALYSDDPLLGRAARNALEASDALARLDTRSSPADYPKGDFGDALREIAGLVVAEVGLQAATLDLPGWDSHVLQSSHVAPLMRQLGRGLAAFAVDLGPALATTSVVVLSEFGRRLYENAAGGTDHGRGGAVFVLGGGTPGGVRGAWPGLEEDALAGPGDVAVANDYRDVVARVLARHGSFDPDRVFPGHHPEPLEV